MESRRPVVMWPFSDRPVTPRHPSCQGGQGFWRQSTTNTCSPGSYVGGKPGFVGVTMDARWRERQNSGRPPEGAVPTMGTQARLEGQFIWFQPLSQHASKDFRKSCRQIWQGCQSHCEGGQKEEEEQEKGILCHLHLQGVEAGAPRHRCLLQGHVHHELLCQ